MRENDNFRAFHLNNRIYICIVHSSVVSHRVVLKTGTNASEDPAASILRKTTESLFPRIYDVMS